MRGIESHWERIARTFSRKWDVEVVLSGSRCATDGKRIYIPANADDMKGEIGEKVLPGELDHETAHVEEEIIAAEKQAQGIDWPSPMKLMQSCPDHRTRQLLNLFEDVLI